MPRYIAFDVETPNRYNYRMSAIGITVIEDNAITDNFYSLVNPETDFDYSNPVIVTNKSGDLLMPQVKRRKV